MIRSDTQVYYHLILAAHETRMQPELNFLGWLCRVWKHLAQAVVDWSSEDREIAEHVHLLASMEASEPVKDAVRYLRSNAPSWVHQRFPDYRKERSEECCAALSLSSSHLPLLRMHHQKTPAPITEIHSMARKNIVLLSEDFPKK